MLEIAIRIVGFLLAFTGLAHAESLMHADGFWNSGLEAWGYNAQIVLVPIQVAIGLGLLFAPRAEPALTGGTVLLVCFAMYNVVSLLRSTPTCNCLVITDTSPTAAFLIDIVCLGVLLLARGKVEEVPRLSAPLLFSGSLGLIVATLGVSYWSPYILASSGKLVVVPNSRFLGNVVGSDVATRYLRLENRSNKCACIQRGTICQCDT